LKYLMLRSIAG